LLSSWLRQPQQAAWMMGVLNCTPDSFSDGSAFDLESLCKRARLMVSQGADMIDVGGESTRPGAEPVSLEEELRRVIPVIDTLASEGITVSVDTMKAEVMAQAVVAGASMINDVSALVFDEKSMTVVAESGVDVCLMHMQGTPATMQQKPCYTHVMSDIILFFEQRIQSCLDAGIAQSSLLLDPGIGFGKRLEDNLQIIANLNTIKTTFGMPIVLGTSRKSFLGAMTGADVQQREIETAITSAIGVFCGADMIRVHDCASHQKTATVAAKLADAKQVTTC